MLISQCVMVGGFFANLAVWTVVVFLILATARAFAQTGLSFAKARAAVSGSMEG